MTIEIAKTKKQLLDHFYVRGTVFIVDQGIDWTEEFDSWDYDAIHFNLYINDKPVGAARLYKNKVGRVAVLKEYRNRKCGFKLMQAVEDYAKKNGFTELELASQCYIIPFYETLGYDAYGDIFLDAEIEHRMMKKQL